MKDQVLEKLRAILYILPHVVFEAPSTVLSDIFNTHPVNVCGPGEGDYRYFLGYGLGDLDRVGVKIRTLHH